MKIDRTNPYHNFISHIDKNGVIITKDAVRLEKELAELPEGKWVNGKKRIGNAIFYNANKKPIS